MFQLKAAKLQRVLRARRCSSCKLENAGRPMLSQCTSCKLLLCIRSIVPRLFPLYSSFIEIRSCVGPRDNPFSASVIPARVECLLDSVLPWTRLERYGGVVTSCEGFAASTN